MAQSYQMLWNCAACGTPGLLGVTHRCCPNCGSPQDPKKRYFPEEGKEIALENHVYHGVDRVCPFCTTAQGAQAKFCGSCGGDLNGAKAVDLVQDAASDNAAVKAPVPPPTASKTSTTTHGRARRRQTSNAAPNPWIGRAFKAGGALLAVFAALVLCELFWTKPITLVVKSHAWSREIDVETFRSIREGNWCSSKPGDAYKVSRTRKQSGTESVADGQTCRSVRRDNGDGSFSSSQECTTRYKQKPVYSDWCDYNVDRWVVTDTLKTHGDSKDEAPSWPSTAGIKGGTRLGSERVGAQRENYSVHYENRPKGKDQLVALDCNYPLVDWKSRDVAAEFTAKQGVLLGTVICEGIEAPTLAH